MEGRGRKQVQLSSTDPTKSSSTSGLRNFTIPRKKRVSGQALLEPCPKESRDYCLIHSKLRDARLDTRKEHANAWLWKDVKLVHNEEFLKEFSEKRSEMRAKGRHGRDMEERFCFLVASDETTNQIYQHGLRTETQEQFSLGKPSHGVYLFRHVDVALKHAATRIMNGKNLIVFKVLYGKVKIITPSSEWNRTPDPMVSFDCHMSKDTVSHRDSLSQQVLGSSVFLFDYNENQELNKRPRQCLPYAMVSFVPAFSATPPRSISPPASPVKHPTSLKHGPLEHLRGCTVAKRRGKGENARVTFKHFATQGCAGPDYTMQTHGVDPTPFQNNEPQNPLLFSPPQLYMPLFQTAGYFSPSLPYVDGIPFLNNPEQSPFPSNQQLQNTTSIYESNADTHGVIPQTEQKTEKISTIVYSSRLVKDPRLARQDSIQTVQATNIETKCSEQDKASGVSECDEQGRQPHPLNQEEKNEFTRTVSCEEHSLEMNKDQSKNDSLKFTQSDPKEPISHPQPKTENMPSMKLFKMKFQKYAAYLKMTEDERHKHIWSQEGQTPEEKQVLIDRIQFYDTYYRKYKQGLLFQKDTETENDSNAEPKNNVTCLSTKDKSLPMSQDTRVNQADMKQISDVTNLTSTTDLVHKEKHKADTVNVDNSEVRHNGTEFTVDFLEDRKQDSPPGSQNGSEAQPAAETSVSEQSLEQGSVSLKTSEESEAKQSAVDFEQSLCQSYASDQVKINPKAVSESGCFTTESESTQYANMEENPLFNNIPVLDVSTCSNNSSANTKLDQNSPRSTKHEAGESQTYSEPDDSSEMSIEVTRGDNTIHSTLYKRLQLDQLLPNLNGANTFSNKSYLRSKDLEKIPCINQLYGHLNETVPKLDCNKTDMQNLKCREDIIVMRRSIDGSATTERLTLSERFSKLRDLHNRLTKLTRNNMVLESDPKDLSLSSSVENGTRNNNVKLIQLLAQRFSKAMSHSKARSLREVSSRRKTNSSVFTLKHLSRIYVLKRRKRHLQKAIKRCKTKLHLSKSNQGQVVSSKLTLNPSSCPTHTTKEAESAEVSDLYLDSSAVSQSCAPENLHKVPCNESSQEDNNILTVDHSSLNTSEKQSTEVVCEYVLRISSNGDIKKSHGDIQVVKDPVMTDKMKSERGTHDSSICHQDTSFPITCSVNNESKKEDEIAKREQKEEAPPQKKLLQANAKQEWKDKCATGELSTDYNAAYVDKNNAVQAEVSNIPSGITTSNTTSNSAAVTKTAMASAVPGLMNNDKIDKLYDSVRDNAGSGVIKSVVEITDNVPSVGKTEEMVANINIKNSDEYSPANSTDKNDKEMFSRAETSDVGQSSLTTLQSAKELISSNENTSHPSELASSSQCQPPEEFAQRSRITSSHVATTADLHNSVIKDAKEVGVAATMGNLESTWQGQDKNNVSSTSTETQLISKLRNYLTKFEFTVKKQDMVNDSVKDGQVPMAWITLDSTVHKQQLFDTRHYNMLDLQNLQNQGCDLVSTKKENSVDDVLPPVTHEEVRVKANVQDETNANFSATPIKRKTKSYSYTSKRKRRSKLARVSPDSTSMLETVQEDSSTHLIVNKDTDQPEISNSAPDLQQCMQNQTVHSQSLENINVLSAQQCHVDQSAEKATKSNEQGLFEKRVSDTYVQNEYSVTDISSILKLADHTISVAELRSLLLKCKSMLQHFISNFERDQNISFIDSGISRNRILERYLEQPPSPVELKFEGLNSFLELQMMMEVCQFVENKINFLNNKSTFRSLLWYDPSLYGELYKGAVGFQQQSSLFSSFQKGLAIEGFSKLQEYYTAVSTLHQQLQEAPDTSYYMYLKSKRERLEIEAALRNPQDIKSFFLSVPISLMMNFGDSLENLEKAQRIVMTFVETPSDRLPGKFDVGKAEHLSIICRYLQEKITFLKSCEQTSKAAWFGLEHLLYDASKLLVWRESEYGVSNEVLLKYKMSNPQIVYGVTEAGIALIKNMEQQKIRPAERAPPQIPSQKNTDTFKNCRKSGISTDRAHTAQDIPIENGTKETYQPARRRATHPPVESNLNDGGVNPFIQPSLPPQLGNPPPFPGFPPTSSAVHWRMSGNHGWDWNPAGVIKPSKAHSEIRALLLSKRRMTIPCTKPRTDVQNSHAVRQQQQQPLIINPGVVERINHQPLINAPHHAEIQNQQTSKSAGPLTPPFAFPCLPPVTSSVVPPSAPLLSFPNTSNQASPHEISTPINYPFFAFNGQTYSTLSPSVPVPGSTLHTQTKYHDHPV